MQATRPGESLMTRLRAFGLSLTVVAIAFTMGGCAIFRPIGAAVSTVLKTTGKVVGKILP